MLAGRLVSAPALVVREDLSQRKALSKSEVLSTYYCPTSGFYARTQPRPWVADEGLVFGSAVDAGVEQVLAAHRSGFPANAKAREAAAEVILRDDIAVDLDEVMQAVDCFERDIVPEFDWTYVGLQVSLNADFPGIGPVNGHPDVIVYTPAGGAPSLWDVKTTKRNAKSPDDLWAKPELAIYAALFEQETGDRLSRVGYFTWIRSSKKWQTLSIEVDQDLIDFGTRELRRQANLRRQFDAMAGVDPSDWFPGPAFISKCGTCAYRDICTTGKRNVARLGGTTE